MKWQEAAARIVPADRSAMQAAAGRWNSIAKPLHSLGKLETCIIRMAGMTGSPDVEISAKAIAEMCADNGVVAEGVTQTGQEVTAIVAENFLSGDTCACIMGQCCGADIFPFDIGMVTDTEVDRRYKVRYGTANMAEGPAMNREDAEKSIEAGIDIAISLKNKGYGILACGEMGIGNTTSGSAVAGVLLGEEAEVMTGRGAGLSPEGVMKKIHVIRRAIEINRPDPSDPLDVLAKVGGLDIGAMAGLYLGGAVCRIPVVLDGFISGVAALVAARLCPEAADYMLASHASTEPGAARVLEAIGMSPILYADMCLGEGTGAAALFPLLEMACRVYRSMSTFSDIHVEQYKELS